MVVVLAFAWIWRVSLDYCSGTSRNLGKSRGHGWYEWRYSSSCVFSCFLPNVYSLSWKERLCWKSYVCKLAWPWMFIELTQNFLWTTRDFLGRGKVQQIGDWQRNTIIKRKAGERQGRSKIASNVSLFQNRFCQIIEQPIFMWERGRGGSCRCAVSHFDETFKTFHRVIPWAN